jgi:hypothetical protein
MSNFQRPAWRKPAPLGYGSALDSMSNVAAPLLAGFSITAIAAVAADSDKFRWPGAALVALTLATILLVASLQFGFHARGYLYSGEDLHAWWTAEELERRSDELQQTQHDHFDLWKQWSAKARLAYNAGIIVLAVGIALLLAPPHSVVHAEAILRWIAAALAGLGALGEFGWGAFPAIHRRIQVRGRK